MKKAIRIFDMLLAVMCTLTLTAVGIADAALPDDIVIYDGNAVAYSEIFSYTDSTRTRSVDLQSAYPTQESLKLFGIIPVKDVTVYNKQRQKVLVSGEVFGIKLYTDGVIVVGIRDVDSDKGKVSPAEKAGVEVGDIIISINGVNVYTSNDVQNILNDNNGKPYEINVKRGERYRSFTLEPVYSSREGCYKAGMWVRDSTAGIGTLTFYNEYSGNFAALGHQINDVDTKELMPLLEGEAVGATVTQVQKGARGVTGSLCCDFNNYTIGRLYENTSCGIYGAYTAIGDCATEYPVASEQEVKRGKAQIIATVEQGAPRAYDIEITHISYSDNNEEKNMIIKVTDDELIEKTGGIVQGMSGSPIIQNGKLVGAVTHVIVDNPQKGYAIFAQTMLIKSEQ